MVCGFGKKGLGLNLIFVSPNGNIIFFFWEG